MSKYYYLIASLPELTLEDNKLSYTVADLKEELYDSLSDADKKLIDLFYLQFDNRNVLKLVKNKEAAIDMRGNYSSEELLEYILLAKEAGEVNPKLFPPYLSAFVSEYFSASESGADDIFWEDRLAALYYEYGMHSGNDFISSWFEWNLNINNILAALTARKHKWEIAPLIVGNTETSEALRTSGARDFGLQGDVDYLDQVMKLHETQELLEREKKTDTMKWDWIEEANFFHYFTVERLYAFLLQLEMIERWISLDKEKGSQMFRKIIDSLKQLKVES
ncbi:hypothetical protein EZS27_009956 [termite gut metagenome]|jgi:hypothetical protein|uniref:DUF2764 domain-containing protein n=1 Tax=termite gut metagenome TaxID=433724 RepID=A0A5J4SAH0_9ZZZZ